MMSGSMHLPAMICLHCCSSTVPAVPRSHGSTSSLRRVQSSTPPLEILPGNLDGKFLRLPQHRLSKDLILRAQTLETKGLICASHTPYNHSLMLQCRLKRLPRLKPNPTLPRRQLLARRPRGLPGQLCGGGAVPGGAGGRPRAGRRPAGCLPQRPRHAALSAAMEPPRLLLPALPGAAAAPAQGPRQPGSPFRYKTFSLSHFFCP